ncbi:MAG: NAD-dependent epimerase/dehydratase family protein [Thermomicrobiales bacterium]|nr:MAG: NAD-dependent epimerase/dehydratase family protein [Thermomicrobiales bacterium]
MSSLSGSTRHVLVTGVAGFLGSHLLDRLLAGGHRVIGVDDLSKGSLRNIAGQIGNPAFRFLERDLTDPNVFSDIGEEVEYIAHLASHKIPRYGNALATLRVNTRGCEHVLEYARKVGCKTVIASTSDVYGRNPKLPFGEDDDSVFGSSKVARWGYAVSKLFTEHLGFAYQEAYGLPVSILRFFGSYGPRNHVSWWGGPQAVFIDAILNDREITIHGDGLQTRSFTYVTDTVEGIYAAMVTPAAYGEILNIGTTHEVTILELARTIHRLAGTPWPLKSTFVPYQSFTGGKYEDVRRRVPDIERSQRILGVTARVGLEEGLMNTINWQRGLAMPASLSSEPARLQDTIVRV